MKAIKKILDEWEKDVKPLTLSKSDLKYLETRSFQIDKIAKAFTVPKALREKPDYT